MTRGMMAAVALIATAGVLSVAPAGAQTRLDREGTVGLSVFGGYGTITGESRLGLDFRSGGGYGLNLRYTLNPRVSLGLTFRNQTYTAVNEVKSTGVDKLVTTDLLGELYYYRNRNADASQYAVFGLGFYRPEVHRSESDIVFPGENLILSAGLGVEVFIRENWGLDLSARGFGYFGEGVADAEETLTDEDGNLLVTSQGSFAAGISGHVGLIYYLAR